MGWLYWRTRRYRTTLERLALADDESASAKADAELTRIEAESVRKALNHAIENFKNSEEFKEEILEGGFTSYCIRYENDWDKIKRLYPDLDLSNIISPISEDGTAEEATPTEDEALTAPEVVQISDATPEQRDRDDKLWSV